MKKKKILVVCQHYFPENFQITEICEELVKSGYIVTALVGLPNYPLGYIFDDYKHHRRRQENINGVNVVRCFEIARRKNIAFLALNYLSFWFSSSIKASNFKERYDVVLGYETSPITMIDAARIYAKKNNVPFIIWCCDIWPECLKVYIKSECNIIFKIYKKISQKIYSSADIVLCQSPSFKDYLKKTHDINNTEDLPYFVNTPIKKNKHIENNVVDFVFMGNVGKIQNLERVIDALEKNKESNFLFHIVGDGSNLKKLKSYVRNMAVAKKIIFHGFKTKNELNRFYEIADACIVSLNSDNEIGYTLPTKVQGYMAERKPILGLISGSAKEVIEKANCGFCADGNDVDMFAKYINEFIKNYKKYQKLGENGYKYFSENFAKKIVMDKLIQIIDNTMEGDDK